MFLSPLPSPLLKIPIYSGGRDVWEENTCIVVDRPHIKLQKFKYIIAREGKNKNKNKNKNKGGY